MQKCTQSRRRRLRSAKNTHKDLGEKERGWVNALAVLRFWELTEAGTFEEVESRIKQASHAPPAAKKEADGGGKEGKLHRCTTLGQGARRGVRDVSRGKEKVLRAVTQGQVGKRDLGRGFVRVASNIR